MLHFRELAYVLAIVENGGFSNAAKKLFISQPSLSQYIKKLEDSLGFAIFERCGNSIRLTYEGKEYVAFARETLLRKEQFLQIMDDISSLQKGHLKIGVPFFRSMFFAPKLLPAFKRKYPGIIVELFEQPSPALEKAVAHREIDFAFANLPVYTPGISYELLMDEMILLSIPEGHALCGRLVQNPETKYPSLDLKLASDEPFIMMPSHYRLRVIANHICLDCGFTPSVLLETSNFGTAEHLAAEGLGLTFAPESLILDHLKVPGIVHATFANKDYMWPIAILYAAKGHLSDAAKTFMKFAKDILPAGDRRSPSQEKHIGISL